MISLAKLVISALMIILVFNYGSFDQINPVYDFFN